MQNLKLNVTSRKIHEIHPSDRPVILVFMLLLVNNKKLMGEYTNGRIYNVVSWMTVLLLVGLSLVYPGSLVRL